ncbi:unnamed protein product [Urochloa humidicola]
MMIKSQLKDLIGVPQNWDTNLSPENLVTDMETSRKNLSGLLSPSAGNLINLETPDLSHNSSSGPILRTFGRTFKHKSGILSSALRNRAARLRRFFFIPISPVNTRSHKFGVADLIMEQINQMKLSIYVQQQYAS